MLGVHSETNELTVLQENKAEIGVFISPNLNSDSIFDHIKIEKSSMPRYNEFSVSERSNGGSFYILDRITTCKNVQSISPNEPMEETETFRRTDSNAYVWVHLTDIYKELKIKWMFFDPFGNLHWEQNGTIPDPISEGMQYWEWYNCWNGIYIQHYLAEDLEGLWTAEVYIDEGNGYQLQATEQFVIGYMIADWVLAKDVQSTDPYDPIEPTTSFSSTDTKVCGWIQLDKLAETIEIKWEWYDPSGSLYFPYESNTIDPATDGHLYWIDYKLWSFINIHDTEAASKPGQWQLQVYIKDVYGDWDLEFSEYFIISERVPLTTETTPETVTKTITTKAVTETITAPTVTETMTPEVVTKTNIPAEEEVGIGFVPGFTNLPVLLALPTLLLLFRRRRK